MTGIAAGALRHRGRIEQLVVELDSDGERTETWVDAFGVLLPAEIAPLSGRELVAAAAVQSKVAVRIRVRYRPGISASMRFLHRDVAYGIEAVTPDTGSGVGYLTLHCTQGVNEG